jgi:hypothetical protein
MEFDSVTVALPITAPVGSVTTPETVPALPADWTRAGAGRLFAGVWARSPDESINNVSEENTANEAEMPRRVDVRMEYPLLGLPAGYDEVLGANDVKPQAGDG